MTVRVMFPFVGDTIGGSHISAALLMAELGAFGFASVAVVHRDGPLAPWLISRGIEVKRPELPMLPKGSAGASAILSLAAMAPRLAGFLRREEVSLVHANDGRMIATWMPAARLAGTVAIAHRRTVWSRSRLAHLALRLANRIIAISAFVRDSLPQDLQRRTVVIENPFKYDCPSRAAARRIVIELMNAEGDDPVIAFVGTLQEQKRPLIFLRAAQIIQRQRPDVRFLLIGREGGQGMQLRSLVEELGLSDRVVFTGFRNDVSSLLAGSDLLLAPAVREGHGRALVEAMFNNLPVVAAASGGHFEVVKPDETGILVPADEPQAFADAALKLLNHPAETQAMAAAAGNWARRKFSPAGHARAVASVYRDMLKA
jgi:glycosyltransferase involved in cell wall biosynthesis